ncbi:MAG: glycosyltransferase family 1 protein [SAR86 cluster bacterium]|nr:glycosyltransferase family 1 protein [SAR86 cluster bacterium]|tara:strand:- start:2920 stop:3912 length:993 start_codon:yes stop_codon:yes gene_type:complete
MKKILIITDAWEPQVNGVVTTMTTVLKHLKKKNFLVEVLHPGHFHTFPLPNYPEISIAWNFWDLKKKIKKINPDFIHISVEGPLGVTARHFCVEQNIPYTSAIHTKFPEYVYERFGIGLDVTKGLLKWFHNSAAKTLVNTKSHKEELIKDGFTDLVLWSRGFDDKIFYPSNVGGKGNYLLYVGRVAIEKNIEEFLTLDTKMQKVVVGGGPKLKSYQKKYKDVKFLGYKSGRELAEIYRDAACFVFPSKTDTFGIVLIESLACGTPLAGFNVTGPKDIVIEGVNGCLTEDNLLEAVNNAIACDRKKVFETSVDYTWEKVTEQFISSLVSVK